MEKYGFVYIWYDRKHKRYYLGAHWGSESDGYICSSPWMRKAYARRPHDFKRRILARIYTNRKDTFLAEEKYLDLIKKEEFGVKYYNLKHVKGHWSVSDEKLKSLREKISATATKNAQDPVYREKYLQGIKKRDNRSSDPIVREKRKQSMIQAMGIKFPTAGRKKASTKGSEEHRHKLSEASKRRWAQPDAKIKQAEITSKNHKGKKHRLGHINSQEHIEKIRAANIGKKRTAEQKQRMSEARKGKAMTAAMKEQHSKRIKEMWGKRRAGILPMPNYGKEKQGGMV